MTKKDKLYGESDNYKMPEVDITIESVEIKANRRTLNLPKLPKDYKHGLQNKPEDFMVYHHAKPQKEYDTSGGSISILPELKGVPWNEISMCYVLSLNPSAVRVSTGMVTADSCPNRITVIIDNEKDRIIDHITMEVCIQCPEGYCGYDLALCLAKLKRGDKTPYKSISERQKESKDGSVQIGPGMWIGPPDISFFGDDKGTI